MKALDELTKARSLLVLDHCFWGMLAMRLKMRVEEQCPTAATDGEMLLFNPKYIETLSTQQGIGLLAHEVMHCAMGDIWRLDGRDALLWNMACDYVNNKMLIEAGFTLPEGCLLDSKYDGMCKEEVYNLLYKNAIKIKIKVPGDGEGKDGTGQGGLRMPGQGQGSGQGDKYADPGKCGSMFKPQTDPNNPDKYKDSEVEWKTATAQAANLAKGDVPANMRKMIQDEVLDPPLPYHVLLRDFLQRTARNDYNWSRPNRKYLQQDIILPGLLSDELPMVALIIDSSGSTDNYQKRFAHEVSAVLSAFKTTITLMYVDAKVHEPVEEYKTEDLPLKFEYKGGGGTDFRPAFDYIEEKGITPACMIYLTDLYGDFPKEPPEYPVMWVSVSHKGNKAPFGETVEMKLD